MATHYGDWKVVTHLGEGGQAHTFLVRNIKDHSEGVLKRLKNLGSQARLHRFRQEAELAQKLDHPGIARILDRDIDAPKPYIVFEHKEGRDLAAFVQEGHSLLELLAVILSAHKIMQHVHSPGACHRDLKPQHVIIDKDGEVSIIDFGLVYFDENERVTMTAEQVGSRFYMAPEMEDGRGTVTTSCDVYSLGKIIYFALSGGKIFSREKHRDNEYDLVRLLDDPRYEKINRVLDKMIVADPAKRYQNAGDAIPELERIMAYFDAVEWERSFTIKEDELRQHKQAWNPSGKGWFTNAGHENEDWAIFGPYHVEPPMPTGLFEAVFSLRARKANRTMGNPTNGRAVIDVASATDGVSGTAILASRRLTPEDMSPAQESLDGWREHSILFFYDGRQEIEFRVMKDAQQHTGVPGTTYILDFLNVKVRRLSSPARTA